MTLELDLETKKELEEFVRQQCIILKEIVLKVKDFIDAVMLPTTGMDDLDQVDKSFYYAFILEVSRTIFINYSVWKRRKEKNAGMDE